MNDCIYLGNMVKEASCKCKMLSDFHCLIKSKSVTPQFDCGENGCEEYLTLGMAMDRYLPGLKAEFARTVPLPNYRTGGGRGIIYVGGNEYFLGIYVGIKLLRKLGCTLPVEVWYNSQFEKVWTEWFDESDNVNFFDLIKESESNGDNTLKLVSKKKDTGWAGKLYAMFHTQLDEVLYLDADAYCVKNPEPLFDLLKSSPFVYWKDYDRMAKNVKWDKVWDNPSIPKVTQIQGGQLLYNRNTAWKLIHAAKYQCQNHEYYFRHMFGDQDALRVALTCGKLPYRRLDGIKWEKVAFLCSYGMHEFVVHRCQGKLFAPKDIPAGKAKYSNPQYTLPMETEVFDLFKDAVGKYTANDATVWDSIYEKRLWGNDSPSGAGSTLREGQLFIDYVNRIHYNYNLRSVVDVGCGTGVIGDKLFADKYLGLDASKTALGIARKNFPLNDYLLVDITNVEDIPSADSLVCKDVLHHWPTETAVKWLNDVVTANRWRYLILCQDDKQVTDDCYMGGYRALSPDKFPLNQYPYIHREKVHHKTLLVMKLRG